MSQYDGFSDIVNKSSSIIYNNQTKFDNSYSLLIFFMIVVGIEHGLLILKLYLEEVIDDHP